MVSVIQQLEEFAKPIYLLDREKIVKFFSVV